jgi:signal transduction histidine kinase
VSVEAEEIQLRDLEESIGRPFRHEAERRGLSFSVAIERELRTVSADSKRLQQVL